LLCGLLTRLQLDRWRSGLKIHGDRYGQVTVELLGCAIWWWKEVADKCAIEEERRGEGCQAGISYGDGKVKMRRQEKDT